MGKYINLKQKSKQKPDKDSFLIIRGTGYAHRDYYVYYRKDTDSIRFLSGNSVAWKDACFSTWEYVENYNNMLKNAKEVINN